MPIRANAICADTATFKRKKQSNERISIGIGKFREAMGIDAKSIATQKSGLPKDWRNRILK